MKSIAVLIPMIVVLILCASCGAPVTGITEVHTLEEAQALAAEGGGLIVVDFWKDN